MDSYELLDIDKKTFDMILNNSSNDAPWKNTSNNSMLFLKDSIESGLKWKVHADILTAYINPKSKAGKDRQERARKDIEWSSNLSMYPSGILLFDENESGKWEPNGSLSLNQDLVGKDSLMASLMEVFWPDIPPLIYKKITDILVEREFENKSVFLEGKVQVAQDYLDFGKAFKVLSHANKLVPHPVTDWEEIANSSLKAKPKKAPKV